MSKAQKTLSFQKMFLVFAVVIIVVSVMLTAVAYFLQPTPTLGGDFDLTFRDKPWNFKQNSKKLNVLYIGYMKCPDVCPMSLSVAGRAFAALDQKKADKLQLLFLSVDYENDDPIEVADYAKYFDKSFLGLSGSQQQIDDTVSLFHASYLLEKSPETYLGYSISHTDRFYFLNSKGKVVDMISNPRSVEEVLGVLKRYL